MSEDSSPTIVEYFGGDAEGHKCGYCKSPKSNRSHGMWAHTMSVQDYESLIDRGWRRSGHYCYKSMMQSTCCPLYTIRCDASSFQLNRSHKKVLKKVNNFLLKGGSVKTQNKDGDAGTSEDPAPAREEIPLNTSKKKVKKSEAVVESSERGDSWKVPQKKAKILRMERKMNKTGVVTDQAASQTPSKTIEEFLEDYNKAINPAHKLEIKLVNTSSAEFKETLEESSKLYAKYQVTIHKDEEDECTVDQFKRFLVKSPLQKSDGSLPAGYGSFHQQYYIDGKMIAVGVIDLLPSCLSSVYFFYDPDYSFLSLGTYAALREIAFVRTLNQTCPEFAWYYMGFYIHTCPKMVYKGQYRPSYLLCPENYTWHPITECIPKLDHSKYSKLSSSSDSAEDADDSTQISEVGILFKRRAMTYSVYKMLNRQAKSADEGEIREYASLTGMDTARRMLLYRS